MAASCGGVAAVGDVLHGLTADFPTAIVLVLHLSPTFESLLPEVLARRTDLTVEWAEQGGSLVAGTVLIAPRNRHLAITARARCALSGDRRVNFVRPAADLLFSSASAYGFERVLGVVLTGYGEDGARGSRAIRDGGGFVIAQDRQSSFAFGMPEATSGNGSANVVLPLAEIAPCIMGLARHGRSIDAHHRRASEPRLPS
jgi:two-component system chemotaxis response regulator CheB